MNILCFVVSVPIQFDKKIIPFECDIYLTVAVFNKNVQKENIKGKNMLFSETTKIIATKKNCNHYEQKEISFVIMLVK